MTTSAATLLPRAALLGALCLSQGCQYTDGDLFWVSRNKAHMPVWVRGNTDSGVFVIFNHGGPGSSALFEVYREASPGVDTIGDISPLRTLEEDYAVVYWDQRHQGNAQGNADPAETTWEDFAADLEMVVDVMNERHDVDDVFTIGQSWGQSVATMYMTLGDRWETRQSKLTGHIDYKGNIDSNQPYRIAVPKGTVIAQERIGAGDDPDFWRGCIDFWKATPELEDGEDFYRHFDCVYTAMDGNIPFGQRLQTSVAFTLVGPHNGWYHWANSRASTSNAAFIERVVEASPLLETAHRVRVPTLMIHGAYDLVAPPEVGQWYHDTIETPEEDKELVILEDSPHGAIGADRQIFLDRIRGFLETYRGRR
ncbi:MAG: alpha/beta hydrolase [Alphaproteobacteria bacterium]|nr:alpha/beta hydrolase [Alphaproteobacteria bacterium]